MIKYQELGDWIYSVPEKHGRAMEPILKQMLASDEPSIRYKLRAARLESELSEPGFGGIQGFP